MAGFFEKDKKSPRGARANTQHGELLESRASGVETNRYMVIYELRVEKHLLI
jgi:hypothetical protein